jgi:PAS domain S-box-containing protein
MIVAFKNLGLRFKIFLLLTASSLIALLLACATFVYFNQYHQRLQVKTELQRDGMIFAERVEAILDFGVPEELQPVFQLFSANPHLVAAVVYHAPDPEAAEFVEFSKFVRADVDSDFSVPGIVEAGRARPGFQSALIPVGAVEKPIGYIYLLRDLEDVRQRSNEFLGIAAGVLAVSFVIGLLVSLRLQRHITGPLLDLSRGVNSVARQKDYGIRVQRQNEDEIGQLVDDFNEMVTQIHSRDVKLQNVNETLEEKVRERTTEILTTNRRLEAEVKTREQAESALYKSQQKLLMHVQQTPLGVIDWALDGVAQSWNPAAEKIFGWEIGEIVGCNWRDRLVPDEARAQVEKLWVALKGRTGGTHSINKNLTKDGRTIICEWFNTQLVDEDDNVVGIASLVQDITQRVQAEVALRQSEERFSKAFQASPTAVGILSIEDGRFLDVNNNFVKLFEHAREALLGNTDLRIGLWSSEADRQRLFKLLLRNRSVSDFECPLRTATGSVRSTLLSAESVKLGDKACVLLQVHDLTERMSLEAQLRQSQKMEAIGQLAAGVAHDFNNILTIVSGHTSLLKAVPFENPEDSESVAEIGAASDRAANLTRQLLAFSRKQVMQPTTVDLSNVVNDSAKMLKRLVGETIEVVTDFAATPPLAEADIGMIEQIVLNLTVNARDAMSDGGKLTVRTGHQVVDDHDAEQNPEAVAGEYVCLSVTDTGCGMDRETQARIFEPFFTTKEVGKGTGLGLATVYGIVKQHHGWIEVESEPGAGTTFRVHFPAAKADVGNTSRSRLSDVTRGGDEGILLVEDEAPLRKMVSRTLKRFGYQVFEAEHGPQAMAIWKTHQGEIDLLLTDMVMPEGMNGRELAAAIHQDGPDVPVIYTSGYTPELFGEGGEMDKDIVFLAKPYRMTTVADLVREVLDGGEAAPAKALSGPAGEELIG